MRLTIDTQGVATGDGKAETGKAFTPALRQTSCLDYPLSLVIASVG
ncbi:MAG: hypothetical protein OSA42_05890 [Porticoccaceae bacterium]|nr:hypothetical protein [Porticoccaceae bacterium]